MRTFFKALLIFTGLMIAVVFAFDPPPKPGGGGIPEPTSLILLGSGAVALYRKFQAKK